MTKLKNYVAGAGATGSARWCPPLGWTWELPWLAINAVHRDSLSTSRAVKSSELKRNRKRSTEKQEPDKGHSDHRDTYADDKQQ